jgi:MFS family permease
MLRQTGSKRTLWRNVVLLGLVSLLNDTATEMALPLLPAFLTGVLGAGALALGWIEGGADAVASVLKLVSGWWADRSGRNRPFVIAGYTVSSVVRPFLALAGSVSHVLAVRLADRTGKGIRTSPRDVLIAASVEPEQRAAAFSLHRGMDHAGAVIGPLLAFAVLAWWSQNLRLLFALTAIPGAAVILVVLLGVREVPKPDPAPPRAAKTEADAARPARELLRFLLPLGLFTLGNASDVFLLLKAGAERASLVTFPLLWVGLHIVKMVTSIPGGRLADRWGYRRIIGLGWVMYAAVYVGFAFAKTQTAIWGLFLAYGVYYGLTEGPEKALVSRAAPARARGRAFGWYHLTLGMLTLAASVIFGGLWDGFGSQVAFLASAGLALLAVICLLALGRSGNSRAEAH